MPTLICQYDGCSIEFPVSRHESTRRKYCSVACARHGRRGQRLSAYRRREADTRLQAEAAALFGPLSSRDLTIWRHGQAIGYKRGYQRAYAPLRQGHDL